MEVCYFKASMELLHEELYQNIKQDYDALSQQLVKKDEVIQDLQECKQHLELEASHLQNAQKENTIVKLSRAIFRKQICKLEEKNSQRVMEVCYLKASMELLHEELYQNLKQDYYALSQYYLSTNTFLSIREDFFS